MKRKKAHPVKLVRVFECPVDGPLNFPECNEWHLMDIGGDGEFTLCHKVEAIAEEYVQFSDTNHHGVTCCECLKIMKVILEIAPYIDLRP
jgi:hypothetical protein